MVDRGSQEITESIKQSFRCAGQKCSDQPKAGRSLSASHCSQLVSVSVWKWLFDLLLPMSYTKRLIQWHYKRSITKLCLQSHCWAFCRWSTEKHCISTTWWRAMYLNEGFVCFTVAHHREFDQTHILLLQHRCLQLKWLWWQRFTYLSHTHNYQG